MSFIGGVWLAHKCHTAVIEVNPISSMVNSVMVVR